MNMRLVILFFREFELAEKRVSVLTASLLFSSFDLFGKSDRSVVCGSELDTSLFELDFAASSDRRWSSAENSSLVDKRAEAVGEIDVELGRCLLADEVHKG